MIADVKPYAALKRLDVGWLGDVPQHWSVVPGRACFREKQVPNVGMIEDTVLSLSFGRIVIKPEEKLRGLVPESFETYQIVDPGDIIVRPTDLQNDWNSLRVGLSHDRGIITSAYMCLVTTDLLTREFGHLLLATYDLKKVFYGLGSGLRQNLDWADFKYLPCVVPPPAEQDAIVRFLAYADTRILRTVRAKQKLIQLLDEQKLGIIDDAVAKGLDPSVAMRHSGDEWIGFIPAHWSRGRLKDAAVVQTGVTLGKNYGDQVTEQHPYLRVANVQVGRVDLREIKEVAVTAAEAERATLRSGDVLMTEGGDIDKLGRGCVWRGEIPNCLHQNHVFAVRCDEQRLLPEFLVGLMASKLGRNYFQKTAKQTTNLASTNSSKLRAFPIPLPPISEQRQVAQHILHRSGALDEAVERAAREISLLREFRISLISDVVTGKLDVRDVARSLPDQEGPDPGLNDEELAELELDEASDVEAVDEAMA